MSCKREKPDLIGFMGKTAGRTQCGILMHSSLAVTTEGPPLNWCNQVLDTQKVQGTTALNRKINPTRVRSSRRKASAGWRIYGNRSTFSLPLDHAFMLVIARATSMSCFAWPRRLERISLVRTYVDRLAGDGNHTIADEMDEVAVKGLHRIKVKNDKGEPDEALLEIRFRELRILPPIGNQKKYPALTLTVIHAQERETLKRRKKIDWKLLTDLPVQSRKHA
ncbi:hypothetical protein AAE026_38745 [Bradyrhizobium sp. DN5]|uniref:hypothetical protein n=1 Tax=Bradyrhizobium sp. DN5 TaxID=3056950 RepID=UPI003525F61B